MLGGPIGSGKTNSLMGSYSLKLGEAVLRSRTRNAQKSARIEADIANRIKSEFISNMSHELRTPLNTVIGFSKLLADHDRRPLPQKDIVEYAQLIQDASSNLLTIINDILDISKIQSGHFRLNWQEANLDEILESVTSQYRMLADEAGIALDLDYGERAIVIRGDAQKVRQVFGNLVGNAIKFTERGGNVIVSAREMADESIKVVVADTGVGMDVQEIDVAMSPFGQVDGKRTRWREGTGLGLPIAKALIELHGGSLVIESAKGSGTTVCVTFPPPSMLAMMRHDLGLMPKRG
jgi:two-component system cell cycle sensor histidine kinase PleC